jgi:cyclopropane-fatty-acyl-phospholipid synthase
MTNATKLALDWTEQGYVPDNVIRLGIRRLLAQRLHDISRDDCEAMARAQQQFITEMHTAPIAIVPEKANEQHYEVPAAFFDMVLGEHRKYSCCYWPAGATDLEAAEKAALLETCSHAQLQDGQRILELGCGWGSLTLWMAEHYPQSRITAVSNSRSQRLHIEALAKLRGLNNVEVITCDMNDFETDQRYDRVVSVEMFEHMRNWPLLYSKINGWLNENGLFFKHIFVHRDVPYLFEDAEANDWMSRYFFTGGMMPSDDLPLHFQHDLKILQQWRWQGEHYEKTANAWLENMDSQRSSIWPLLQETYGEQQTQTWWMRWRIFFMACAELFAYNHGQEWYVGHYLFGKN